MNERSKGVIAILAAAMIWGVSPVFYHQMAEVPALDVLAHRMIWSLVLFGAVLAVQGRLRDIARSMAGARGFSLIALASVIIALNWGLFIWAVQTGQTTQTSLGYYIYPLVAVVLGCILFGERLQMAQWMAVSMAVLAVVLLAVGAGAAPWIAVALAVSFGVYGVLKKQLAVGPVVSVAAEVVLLVPVAILLLLQTYHNGGAVFGGSAKMTALLVLSGPVTAVPLILFSYAARRLAMSTVGLVLYLNPTLQFACAVFLFGEPFGRWHLAAFVLIWAALGLYSASALRQDRAARNAARTAAVSGSAL